MRIAMQGLPHNSQGAGSLTFGNSLSAVPTSRVVLQSWKEIASELERGVRTVQRWERTLGLPVHRLGKAPRCPVFAFKDELYWWLRKAATQNGARVRNSTDQLEAESREAHKANSPSHRGMLVNSSQLPQELGGEIDERILQSISEFFTAARNQQKKQECDRCQSPRQFMDGYFWLYGTNVHWKMSVPFCPICDREILKHCGRDQIAC
jgi:hypothetical protein